MSAADCRIAQWKTFIRDRALECLTIGVFCTLSPTQAVGSTEDPLDALRVLYAAQIEAAKQHVENPDRITGMDRFRLAFALPMKSIEDQIGRLVLVIDTQDKIIAHAATETEPGAIFRSEPESTDLKSGLAVKLAEYGMKRACGDFSGAPKLQLCRRAVEEFFKIFDLRDVHSGFSGLPFYALVEERMSDPRFHAHVIKLSDDLNSLALKLSRQPGQPVETNLYALALKTCDGNAEQAVELLGILTSRDVLITRYLKFIRYGDSAFLRAFGQAPLMIRLVADLDRKARGSDLDVFSFDGKTRAATERNYYFWSSALVSQRLAKLGFPPDVVQRIALEFPRQYKSLRFLQQRGFTRGLEWYRNFLVNARPAMLVSGRGARVGIASTAGSQTPAGSVERNENARLESFFQALAEPPSHERDIKVRALRRLALASSGSDPQVYILFYNAATSRIGLSHIKLVVDGVAYEIHRQPSRSGSFLRERDLVSSLEDAKPGHLPSGILEIPATAEQKEGIIKFLQVEASGTMQYSLFNKLVYPDAYNCGGIIYESLRAAGFVLPRIPRAWVLSQQIFRELIARTPNSRVVGSRGSWMEAASVPNLNSRTFRSNSVRLDPEFANALGYEFLQAEQTLSETSPLLSNPRRAVGAIIPYFSNTGELPAEYAPASSKVFELIALLIPEGDLGVVMRSGHLSDRSASVAEVSYNGERRIRFFIHPNERQKYDALIRRYPKDTIRWLATPSASARSLFVQDAERRFKPFMAKLSMSVSMGGASRQINDERTVRSVVVSDLIGDIHRFTGGLLPDTGKTWDFLPEPFAVLPASEGLGGMILRELPNDVSGDILLPWFSLISDRTASERWVDELFRYSGRQNLADFVWTDLVKPLVELHQTLAIQNGLTTELHQQNTLIRVDRTTKKVLGLVVRDMDAHFVDHSVRTHRLGKPALDLGTLEADTYVFRYAYASENQVVSYADVLRSRNVENIFRYVLDKPTLRRTLEQADSYLLEKFRHRFPEVPVAKISEYSNAWRTLHERSATPEEVAAYDSRRRIEAARRPSGPRSWLIDLGKVWNLRKLQGPRTGRTFLECVGRTLSSGL